MGIPAKLASTSHAVLRRWICFQSCATTTAAIVMESNTASGAATFSGMHNASRGTANIASPNPKVERMSVAAPTTSRTYRTMMSMMISGSRESPRIFGQSLSSHATDGKVALMPNSESGAACALLDGGGDLSVPPESI